MVLGALMKRKARKEGRAEGLDEGLTKGHSQGFDEGLTKGRAGANREWRAWLERKTAAETAGHPFHEPPPDSP